MENMGIERMVEVLKELNPTADFEMTDCITIIVDGLNREEIKLPEGYYLSEMNGLVNKNNTEARIYYLGFLLV